MHLIFIHGSGGAKEFWHYQTNYFTNSEAIDLPGHPKGKLISTIDGYAQWLNDYINERGYRDVVLAGHSFGGGIALSYVLQFPGVLKAMILVGSGLRLRVHPMLLHTLEKAIDNPRLFTKFTNPTYERIDAELSEIIKRRTFENGPAVMLSDMKAGDQFDAIGRESEFNLPTLAICGADDVMTPPKYTRFMADNIPGARAVIIPGGTHFVFAEKPEEFNKVVENFLEEI